MVKQDDTRHEGFVVGSDSSRGASTVWKVRVKDRSSPHDGKKLIVASIHGGIELARGLNVNFAIGTVDDSVGDQALRAVDVRLSAAQPQSTTSITTGQKGQ